MFFRPTSHVKGEYPQEEEIRDGETDYPGMLAEQPLWNNVGGWEANKDVPVYDESHDLLNTGCIEGYSESENCIRNP